jgi:hypothetical protein
MTPGIVAFIVGLYVLPLVLLWWGHRFKRLPARSRRAFWGAVIGHCVAGTIALTAGMVLPEEWDAQERLRGFAGLWSLLIFPLAGAAASALLTPSR